WRRSADPLVADAGGDGCDGESGKAPVRRLLQLAPALDGIYPAAEMRQHCSLVARPGADLEHLVALVELEMLGHESNHEGLRDGLPAIDGQRDVLVGVVGEGLVDE